MSDEARVILAGPDERDLTRSAYPALTAAGFSVLAVVDTVEKLRDVAAAAQADLVVVEADLALEPDEALELLSGLKPAPSHIAVILPLAWGGERERFGKLPNLLAGFSAPVNWASVARKLSERMRSGEEAGEQEGKGAEAQGGEGAEEALRAGHRPIEADATMGSRGTEEVSSQRHPPLRLRGRSPAVRIGFYGARGGVGVSTAALRAAQELAGEGRRVALFDETRRGDLHLMAGLQPTEQPIVFQRRVTIFLGAPTEEKIRDFDAVVVDGGRKRGNFNAGWEIVSRPLDEDRVRRLVGLEPREAMSRRGHRHYGEEQDRESKGKKPPRKKRALDLGKLISFEVTD